MAHVGSGGGDLLGDRRVLLGERGVAADGLAGGLGRGGHLLGRGAGFVHDRGDAGDGAAPPERANKLYEYFVSEARKRISRVETGRFQAMMDVESVNDGPVTIILDSEKTF